MNFPVRGCFGTVLGVLAFLGPLCGTGQAQWGMGMGMGHNPYVNPMGGMGGFGGYGTALSGAFFGGGFGYGMGYGSGGMMTQWMMNPYQGYERGAADTTRANAQYYQTIQQARTTRQETIRSSLETRRAMIEEAEWERAHMPDPEKIRQRVLQRELSAARSSAPANDIWSARALNTLLRHLITQQADGAKGPTIPLSKDIVSHINIKVGDSVGHIGLLKNNGELDWPESLQGDAFKEGREQINNLMHNAYKNVSSGSNPSAPTLNDLQDQYRKMRQKAQNEELKPNDYIEAKRYLDEIGQTIKGLGDPNVGRQFNEKPQSKDVADLVRHMREKGLLFAPATQGDEAAYTSLYHAFVSFDAGMTRLIGSGRRNLEGAGNR